MDVCAVGFRIATFKLFICVAVNKIWWLGYITLMCS